MSARRKSGGSDSRRYYDWLDKAQSDIRGAQILHTYGGDNDLIAFHCQQAIEKALKGYLLFRLGRHFDGHSLIFLCRQACKLDDSFREYLDESTILNDYYIETRYPTDIPTEVTDEQIRILLDMANRMFRMIKIEIYEEKI